GGEEDERADPRSRGTETEAGHDHAEFEDRRRRQRDPAVSLDGHRVEGDEESEVGDERVAPGPLHERHRREQAEDGDGGPPAQHQRGEKGAAQHPYLHAPVDRVEQLVEAEGEERQSEERVGGQRMPAEDPERPDGPEGWAARAFVGVGEEPGHAGDEPTGPGGGGTPRRWRHASRYRRLTAARAIAAAAYPQKRAKPVHGPMLAPSGASV